MAHAQAVGRENFRAAEATNRTFVPRKTLRTGQGRRRNPLEVETSSHRTRRARNMTAVPKTRDDHDDHVSSALYQRFTN